ncbi:MAG: hypothetical protein ACYCSO_00955 [Cuniculiplasma sp.]
MRRKIKIILAILTVAILLSVAVPLVYEKDQSIMPLILNQQYISMRVHNLTSLGRQGFWGSPLQAYYPVNVTYKGFGSFEIAMTRIPWNFGINIGHFPNETFNASHFNNACIMNYHLTTLVILLKSNYTGYGSIGIGFVRSSLYNSNVGYYVNMDNYMFFRVGSSYKIGPYLDIMPNLWSTVSSLRIFNGTYYMSLTVAVYRTVLGIPFDLGDITFKAPVFTVVNATSTA